MAGRKPSQKEQAYELFDQGFGPSDPEVKEMVPNPAPAIITHQSGDKTEGSVIMRLKNCISSTRSHIVYAKTHPAMFLSRALSEHSIGL
jgi:hypothetical protein